MKSQQLGISLVFVSILLYPYIAHAQLQQLTLSAITEKTWSGFRDEEKTLELKVFHKKGFLSDGNQPHLRTNEVISSVDYFFKNTKVSCGDSLCFDLIPVPVVYFESEDKSVQFLGLATGSRIGFMFRKRF